MSDTPFSALSDSAQLTEAPVNDAASPRAPARLETLAPIAGPQRYQVQFTGDQEYVELVERAQALLSHTSGGELAELHLRAMRVLVADLEKRKYATKRGTHVEAACELKAVTETERETEVESRPEVPSSVETAAEAEAPREAPLEAEGGG
jgi:hypothetical protein